MPNYAPVQFNRVGHSKSFLLTALLAASLLPSISAAQGVDLRVDTDYTTWTLLGSATASNYAYPNGDIDSSLLLTYPGIQGQAGAGFAPDSALINFNQAFTFNFFFFVPPGSVAQGDGMTFVITGNDPVSGNVLGSGGSDLGYGGSDPGSFAFAIDTFNFKEEPTAPSIQILQDGSVAPLAYTETGLADIRDPSYFQWMGALSYTPSGNDDEMGILTGTIDQYIGSLSFNVSANVDWSGVSSAEFDANTGDYLGRYVHYGFTAGNGLADDGHIVTSITAVPEPETYAMLLAGLGLVGFAARKRAQRS